MHGRGLFAAREIGKGRHIGTFEGRPTRRDSSHVLWLWDEENQEWSGLLVTNDLRFTNHSDQPNARLEGVELVARRRIREGEEITISYDDWE